MNSLQRDLSLSSPKPWEAGIFLVPTGWLKKQRLGWRQSLIPAHTASCGGLRLTGGVEFHLGMSFTCTRKVRSGFSRVPLVATPQTVARQAPLSMGFSRQEYWSVLPRPPPGHLPHPGIELLSLASPWIIRQLLHHSCHLESPTGLRREFYFKVPSAFPS